MIAGQKMIEIQNKNDDLINAYHEIGHLFIASLWNFKVKKISI